MIHSKRIKLINDLIEYLKEMKSVCIEDVDVVLNDDDLGMLIDSLDMLKEHERIMVIKEWYSPRCLKCEIPCLASEVFCNKCTRDMQDKVREINLKGVEIPPIVKTNDYDVDNKNVIEYSNEVFSKLIRNKK